MVGLDVAAENDPPGHFMNGEQGILNYVLNRKAALEGLRVERREIMRWPGHSMDGLDAESISKRIAPPLIIHWAGMKKICLRHMAGSDILLYFEKFYYSRLPAGTLRRLFAICRHFLIHWQHWVGVRIKLSYRRRIANCDPVAIFPTCKSIRRDVKLFHRHRDRHIYSAEQRLASARNMLTSVKRMTRLLCTAFIVAFAACNAPKLGRLFRRPPFWGNRNGQ